MKKRIVTILLTLCLMVTLAIPAMAAGGNVSGPGLANFQKINTYQQGQFYDVSAGDWFADNVKAAWEFGLMNGVSETQFSPAGSMTLAEAITLAARIHSIYYYGQANFEQGNPWYQSYVDYALRVGLIWDGQYSDYTRPATRAEFAVLLAAAMASEALPGINSVSDIPDVQWSDSYGEAVFRLYNAGILTGSDAYGTFHPNNNIARSEVAAIVTRMADPSLRKTFTMAKPPIVQANDAMWEKYASISDTAYKGTYDLNGDGIIEILTGESMRNVFGPGYSNDDIYSCSIYYWSNGQIVRIIYKDWIIGDGLFLVYDTVTGQYGLSRVCCTGAFTQTFDFLDYSGYIAKVPNGGEGPSGEKISESTYQSIQNRYQYIERLHGYWCGII